MGASSSDVTSNAFLRKIAQYLRLNREGGAGFSAFMSVFLWLASINTLNFAMPSCLHFLNGDTYEFSIISRKISEDYVNERMS